MFGNLGMGEMMIALLIVLVLFGAKRVPEISASFGKGIREFKRNMSDVEDSIRGPVDAPRLEHRPLAAVDTGVRRADEERPEPKRLL